MKKHRLIIILLFALNFHSFGQSYQAITTFAQNNAWIDSLDKSPLDLKIEMIKERMLRDTAVYYPGMTVPIGILRDKVIHIPQHYVANLKISDLADENFKINGVKGESRLMYAIRLEGKHKLDLTPINRSRTTRTHNLMGILNLLSIENIKKMEIIKDSDPEMTLFGTSSRFGIIILETDKKEIYNKIIELNK